MAVESQNEANIDVSDFIESEFCQITADGGSVQANRIKTESMIVSTQSGDVICTGHIQGTVNISSNSGNVVSEQRFIGPSLDISTDTGDIRVASSYADQSKFVTNKGRIHLRNIHNESYIASYESGDVKVKGIDGSTNIFVKKGDLEIHISQIKHESRILVEEGDITLKVILKFANLKYFKNKKKLHQFDFAFQMIDTHPVKLNINANQIIPDTKFAQYGKLEKGQTASTMQYSASIQPNVFSPSLTVIAENGNVVLESQDWAASLGLKMATPKYNEEKLKL